jgi:8-oxo-dGTP pyrophosphatase MutT (NUDIX family)
MLSGLQRRVGQLVIGGAVMAGKALLSPVVLGANAMIFNTEGKVVLVRHSYMRGLSFPGGGVQRGEAPMAAVLRELREEIGSVQSDPPVFFGLYTRRAGWATNVIVIYRLMNAVVEFRPNLEVREMFYADPASPPAETTSGTARRLAEYSGKRPPSPYW